MNCVNLTYFQKTPYICFMRSAETMIHPLFEIVRSFLECFGKFDGSGWTTAITNSSVASSGVAESFLGVSHITGQFVSSLFTLVAFVPSNVMTFVLHALILQEIRKSHGLTAPIRKNRLKLLDTSQKSTGNKSEVTSLKEEWSKVIQLLLAANSGREIDKSVFAHKSCLNPPSLSRKEQMFYGTKADILPLLEAEAPPGHPTRPLSEAAVLAIVHLIKPGNSVTIGKCIHTAVFPYLLNWLEHLHRLDIICTFLLIIIWVTIPCFAMHVFFYFFLLTYIFLRIVRRFMHIMDFPQSCTGINV